MKSDKTPSEARSRGFRAGARRLVLVTVAAVAAVTAMTLTGTADAASEGPGRTSVQASPPDGPWAGGQKMSSPPDGPWPQDADFILHLCQANSVFENCHERAITAKQRRALRARLEAMPGVTEVKFESRAQAWANFKKAFGDDEITISAIRPSDMPESFSGTLRRRADAALFKAEMEKAPGVSTATIWGGNFWEGKADIGVTLCGKEKPYDGPCAKRGPVTQQEKAAIEGRLSGLRQVQQIYVEDAAHARRVSEYSWMGKKFRTSMFSEGYYIRLTDPGDAQAVLGAVEDMPGVLYAYPLGTG
ncbi:permease-like cell division protein FtsX [Streptosporangium sp. NPDC000396]|uniref:permease-like cell division protein FtsX n=1 Tax=Streptosporangium sp. NPDC000396 TaxID=3366185 RepID=UPI00367A329F